MKKIIIITALILLCTSIGFLRAQSLNNLASQPYFEGFESTAFPPTGWTSINVSGNVMWMIGYVAHTGVQAAVCAWQQTGIGEDWLITPRWNIETGDSLVFWLRPFFVGYQPDSLAVRVSTTDSMMSSFTTRILYLAEGNGYPTTTIYQRYAVSLNQFAGIGIFIAFKHMDQNGDGIFIDDVSVERPEPSGITVSNNNPKEFKLYQNYPNPFNPVTKIKFDIPSVGQRHAFDVRVVIFDILGKEIAVLVNEQLQPGSYEIEWDASIYPSGVYFYGITVGDASAPLSITKKMVLLK